MIHMIQTYFFNYNYTVQYYFFPEATGVRSTSEAWFRYWTFSLKYKYRKIIAPSLYCAVICANIYSPNYYVYSDEICRFKKHLKILAADSNKGFWLPFSNLGRVGKKKLQKHEHKLIKILNLNLNQPNFTLFSVPYECYRKSVWFA